MKTVYNKTTGEYKEYTDVEFVEERDRRLQLWEDAKKALEVAKELEMQYRKEVVDFTFNPNKQEGTENVELGNGYKAKAVKKVTFGFVKDDSGKLDKKAIDRALVKIEKDGEAGELIAERLIKWTPSLAKSEYKLLTPKHKKIIDEVIVTTEGAPTLSIVKPKSK